jgi:hypothetical protein
MAFALLSPSTGTFGKENSSEAVSVPKGVILGVLVGAKRGTFHLEALHHADGFALHPCPRPGSAKSSCLVSLPHQRLRGTIFNVNGTHMTTEAKTHVSEVVALSPKPPLAAAPAVGGGTSTDKKSFRSGYQREKYRRQRLYAELDDLKLENAQLRQDLTDLEAMFGEMKALNESLVDDLRQARPRTPVPSFAGLMGHRHG